MLSIVILNLSNLFFAEHEGGGRDVFEEDDARKALCADIQPNQNIGRMELEIISDSTKPFSSYIRYLINIHSSINLSSHGLHWSCEHRTNAKRII